MSTTHTVPQDTDEGVEVSMRQYDPYCVHKVAVGLTAKGKTRFVYRMSVAPARWEKRVHVVTALSAKAAREIAAQTRADAAALRTARVKAAYQAAQSGNTAGFTDVEVLTGILAHENFEQ